MSYYYSPSASGDDGLEINKLIQLISSTYNGGGTIRLFDEEYTAKTTIELKSGVYLVGEGSGRETKGYGTRIVSSAKNGISYGLGVRAANLTKVNLHMNGQNAESGIYMTGARENIVNDVWVTCARKKSTTRFYGVHLDGGKGHGCYINTLEHVHTPGCDTGIYINGNSNGVDARRRANANALIRCRTDRCSVGVELSNTDQTNFFAHHAESNSVAGLKLTKNVARTNLHGDYYENNSSGGTDLDLSGVAKGGLGVVKAFGIRKGRYIDPLKRLIDY